MIVLKILAALLFVAAIIGFNVRTDSWRNRRKRERRKIQDRRKRIGRRTNDAVGRFNKHHDRRMTSDRRKGPLTRRHH